MTHKDDATMLYRPVGQKELDLIAESDWSPFTLTQWQPLLIQS